MKKTVISIITLALVAVSSFISGRYDNNVTNRTYFDSAKPSEPVAMETVCKTTTNNGLSAMTIVQENLEEMTASETIDEDCPVSIPTAEEFLRSDHVLYCPVIEEDSMTE